MGIVSFVAGPRHFYHAQSVMTNWTAFSALLPCIQCMADRPQCPVIHHWPLVCLEVQTRRMIVWFSGENTQLVVLVRLVVVESWATMPVWAWSLDIAPISRIFFIDGDPQHGPQINRNAIWVIKQCWANLRMKQVLVVTGLRTWSQRCKLQSRQLSCQWKHLCAATSRSLPSSGISK